MKGIHGGLYHYAGATCFNHLLGCYRQVYSNMHTDAQNVKISSIL